MASLISSSMVIFAERVMMGEGVAVTELQMAICLPGGEGEVGKEMDGLRK